MSEKNKDQFKLVNKDIEEDYLEDDIENIELKEEPIEPKKEMTAEERLKRAKRQKRKRNLIATFVMTIVSGALFGFGLLWQNDTSLLAIGDALWLAFAIEFFMAWVMFVYNMNVFASLIHGTKTFLLMFAGKRTKLSYYEYLKKVEDNQISSYYYNVLFLSSGILLIPALIILFILI